MGTRQTTVSSKLPAQAGATRHCPFCGKLLITNRSQCPHCRETIPEIHIARPTPVRHCEIRRGLLYMLLAAVIHYFAGGYSAMELPFPMVPTAIVYLSSLVFLGGLGLTLYGLVLRITE